MDIENYLSATSYKTREQLVNATGMSDREVRRQISELKKERVVICSSNTKGYRLAKEINSASESELQKEIELIRHGKEIYEGDIVYCQTKYGKAKAIIKFIDGKFVAYWDSILTHPQNGHCIACYEINKRFEVIGNIYEDIELLGGE